MKEFEKQYKALANHRRLAILKYLKENKKATVSDIASKIKLRIKSTSKHLRILSAADFVDREQKSLNVYYFLVDKQPAILKHFLSLL